MGCSVKLQLVPAAIVNNNVCIDRVLEQLGQIQTRNN